MKTLDDLLAEKVAGSRVLVRSDLNVPLVTHGDDGTASAGGVIADDGRVRASLPTIAALAAAGARVVVCAHLGRPRGRPDPALSLRPVAERLQQLLGSPVAFAEDTVGESARATVTGLADGEVAVLENLRFADAETAKDDAVRGQFADRLAALADRYVGDGFGAVHRKHASVYDVPQRLPHYAGALVQIEVEVLTALTEAAERPYVMVLGGAKVSDKLGVISALLPRVDRLLIGGGMCFTFLAAQGVDVGRSLLEADQVPTCRDLLEAAGDKILLPVDVVVAPELSADAATRTVDVADIPADQLGLDIGPRTVRAFSDALGGARTVFWNGPLGLFEIASFAAGTRGVGEAVAACEGRSVVGGGDSAAAVRALGLDETRYSHISTGGGASLEYLEGKTLPGLAALES